MEKCHSSFLMKNQWKIMIFEFWKFQELQKHLFFHGFLQKMKILTSQHLDGQKKKFRDGSGGPKNEFKTLLSNAAIKIWHRLMKVSHF